MVAQHFRWDFVGLSTDTKPTPETSEKVVDGSTFYCSDTSKLYVFCKNDWYERKPLGGGGGGGTTYTAGDGITIADDTISVDLAQATGSSTTKVMSQKATTDFVDGRILAGSAPTTSTVGTVGQLYEDTVNGKLYQCTAIVVGTDPDPDTYTWTEVGAEGGGDSVYSTITTSNSNEGGAVYIGNLDANQVEQPDPTTVDTHRKYFWALPYLNTTLPHADSVNILGQEAGDVSVAIGSNAICRLEAQTAIGTSAINNYSATRGTALGYGSQCYSANAVALGANAKTSRDGEVNVGTGTTSNGYNGTSYRVIGGVHDGQLAQDAVTVAQVNATIDAINTALSTNIPHIGASS